MSANSAAPLAAKSGDGCRHQHSGGGCKTDRGALGNRQAVSVGIERTKTRQGQIERREKRPK